MSAPRVFTVRTASPHRRAVRYGTSSSFEILGWVTKTQDIRSRTCWAVTIADETERGFTSFSALSYTQADAVARVVRVASL